jgi:nicotinamidase/pyrazinamidase
MKALLIVDLQNDFCPGGALPAPEGDKIVPIVNDLMDKFSIILASKDYHPKDTVHFDKWPPHCVAGTRGAEFHPALQASRIKQIFLKGTGNADDGYSSFEATNEDLFRFLHSQNVTDLYIVGLTTEYCVRSTVLDAIKGGFKTFVVADAIEGVKQHEGDVEKALQEMRSAGAQLISSDQIS